MSKPTVDICIIAQRSPFLTDSSSERSTGPPRPAHASEALQVIESLELLALTLGTVHQHDIGPTSMGLR